MGKNVYQDWLDFLREQVDNRCDEIRKSNRELYNECKATVASRMIEKNGVADEAAEYDRLDSRIAALNAQVEILKKQRDIVFASLAGAIPNLIYWSGPITDRIAGVYRASVDEEFEKTPEGAEIVRLKMLREKIPMRLAMASTGKELAVAVKSIADGLGLNLEEYMEE